MDFGDRVRRLLGRERPEVVDPVQLDGDTDLGDLRIASLDPKAEGVDLQNMGDMDVGQNAEIVLASLLTLQG